MSSFEGIHVGRGFIRGFGIGMKCGGIYTDAVIIGKVK